LSYLSYWLQQHLQALPNETSPHFTLATQGLVYAGGVAADILFHSTDCLCEDRARCIDDPNSKSGSTVIHAVPSSQFAQWHGNVNRERSKSHYFAACIKQALACFSLHADMYYQDTHNGLARLMKQVGMLQLQFW
jgi:hypothetical protein